MGANASTSKTHKDVTTEERACLPKQRQDSESANTNIPSIKFHSVHGENIRVINNGTISERFESFCDAITFSNRPVRVNECVYIKFLRLSTNWSGALRFGFTANNPSSFKNCLPKFACPDLAKTNSGNWAKALNERLVDSDTILCFYVNNDGNVHYSINGEDKGVFISGVSTCSPLWAILDVYGNTTSIEILDTRTPLNNQRENTNVANLVSPVSITVTPPANESREPSPQIYSQTAFTYLPFHRTHGCNIRLSNDRSIAERNDSQYSQGYVFSQRPLKINEKLVVQILQTDQLFAGSLAFGLTTCDPMKICGNNLPEDPHKLLERPEYWVVIKDVVSSLHAGDELAFMINELGEVKMFHNRKLPVTLMHVDQTQYFHIFFDLYGSTLKIKSLGSIDSAISINAQNKRLPSISKHSPNAPSSVRLPFPEKGSRVIKSNLLEEVTNGQLTLNNNECSVCYEKPTNSVLYKCGHMCMCYECAIKQWKTTEGGQCPICRALIRDVVRVYWS